MPSRQEIFLVSAVLLAILASVKTDTPANCTYDDILGKWIFYEGQRGEDSSVDCTHIGSVARKIRVVLQYPDIAIDQYGNIGHWTLIYNQGFEVKVNERVYFAFSYYKKDGDNITSMCDRTFNGWSHDVTVRHWACYYGRKQKPDVPKIHRDPFSGLDLEGGMYHADLNFVTRINQVQSQWHAMVYPQFQNMPHQHVLNMRGGKNSWLPRRPRPIAATPAQSTKATSLPETFDWRNISGSSFVSPVRNQGSCGSCYVFSSLGMLEARLRIQTTNQVQLELSPQDVVSCSQYGQGCAGGFPYLIAGKYGMDFGVVEEQCNPYEGADTNCTTIQNCTRHYTAKYEYVGGYYGACNEEAMKIALVERGPLSISFEVNSDFMNYKSGIYHHTGLQDFNPFYLVNHAVLLVGYGVDANTQEKFWIVKNSWGEDWGEDGYFRIRRGTDEVGIESIAVEAVPIPF